MQAHNDAKPPEGTVGMSLIETLEVVPSAPQHRTACSVDYDEISFIPFHSDDF
jgi:hypothetical protein